MKIKSRKEREKEYKKKYGSVDLEDYLRIDKELGDRFTDDVFNQAMDRINDIKHIKYTSLKFTFYEIPIQSHRPRTNFKNSGIHVPNAKANFEAIQRYIKDIKDEIQIISLPMKIKLDAFLPMPSDVNPVDMLIYETKSAYGIGKPDFDNILKAYCDMIQNNFIMDDDLVVSSEFNKYFSLKPRVELEIQFPNGTITDHEYKIISNRKKYKELENSVDISMKVKPYKKKKKKKGEING